MYQNDPTKCLTGEVRISYAHLSAPYVNPASGPNAQAKYSATLLIPKTDTATIKDIQSAIQAAAQAALTTKWNNVKPPVVANPLHDGDGVRQDGTPYGAECKGHWVMTASNTNKPYVCEQSNINTELAPQDIYSGMYARVTVNFFGYANSGRKGVGCSLRGVMKTRDGEPFGGGIVGAGEFEGIGQTTPPLVDSDLMAIFGGAL